MVKLQFCFCVVKVQAYYRGHKVRKARFARRASGAQLAKQEVTFTAQAKVKMDKKSVMLR
eukprot:4578165-Pleurochrysis_carterae.AAC.1